MVYKVSKRVAAEGFLFVGVPSVPEDFSLTKSFERRGSSGADADRSEQDSGNLRSCKKQKVNFLK